MTPDFFDSDISPTRRLFLTQEGTQKVRNLISIFYNTRFRPPAFRNGVTEDNCDREQT